MNKTIKILHIDPDYRVTYFVNHDGGLIHSQLSLKQAISLLKNEHLDLILSEPHQKAILNPKGQSKEMDLDFLGDAINLKKEDLQYGQNE